MSVKVLALVTVAVLGALAAVHLVHNHQTTHVDHNEVKLHLQKLSQGGIHEVNYQMLYLHYKQTHNLTFGAAEDQVRFNVFKTNCDKILAHNANKSSTYELGLTSLAHLSQEEFAATRLGFNGAKRNTKNRKVVSLNAQVADKEVDWSTKGAVTAIKDQGQCGSCWAFSTTGALEGLDFLTNGKLRSFSEQQLVDCSGDYGNQGCNGGLMDDGFAYVAAEGVALEEKYPYTAADGTCKKVNTVYKNGGSQDVEASSDSQLGAAIAKQPVSVAIEADTDAFQLYKTGVLTGDACGTQLDHGVLAVGYGVQDGQKYIKVKNSWGAGWGQKGFILIGREDGDGVCGINLSASYPTA